MDDNRFWSIIAKSRDEFDPALEDGNMDRQAERLRELLLQLEPNEIAAFQNTFSECKRKAYTWDLWAAAYIIEGGCSDDGSWTSEAG